MDKKLRRKWLTALRSGKYKQGTGQLRTDTEDSKHKPVSQHCCLGVLGEVMELDYDPTDGRLDNEMVAEAGLSIEIQTALANLNDGCDDSVQLNYVNDTLGCKVQSPKRRTFGQIATIIEKYL